MNSFRIYKLTMNTQGAYETDGGGWSKTNAYEISGLELTFLISCNLIELFKVAGKVPPETCS